MKTKQKLTPISHKQTEAKVEVIKFGIDVHHCKYVGEGEKMATPPMSSFPPQPKRVGKCD